MEANAYLAEMQRIVDTYQAEVKRAQGDNRRFDDVGELNDAKRVQARAVQDLRGLKQRVTETEKQLQASYQQASATAGGKDHAILSMLGGRKAAGQARADNKRAITANKARAVGPYREVKLRIDDVIRQLTEVGGKLTSAITEQRQASTPKEPRRAVAGGSLTKQLAELAALHNNGALSDDEFAAAKAKLLSP